MCLRDRIIDYFFVWFFIRAFLSEKKTGCFRFKGTVNVISRDTDLPFKEYTCPIHNDTDKMSCLIKSTLDI